MHELGHNLGLGHGGGDEINYKPNYLSTMNYAFQMSGITATGFRSSSRSPSRIDYSREALPALAERHLTLVPPYIIGLDETAGIGDGLDRTKWFCPVNILGIRHIRTAVGNGPIDWNCNGYFETSVFADVNGDNTKLKYMEGFDDWQALRLDFQTTWQGASGAGQGGAVTEELDFAQALQVPQIPSVDIKPGDPGNDINPGASDVIPVAILSDELFDATQVDPLSVRFGPGGATEVHGLGHLEDVNGDGRLDMVLHFATNASGITCGQTSVTLTGTTLGGQVIEGSDDITTVVCKWTVWIPMVVN